jgi:formate hydrogenlyase transcriptional activator
LDETSARRLVQYAWPGNVRELQNVVERAAILAKGPTVHIDDLLSTPAEAANMTEAGAGTLEDIERHHIRRVLETCGWMVEGKRGAATVLGLKPSTLRFRMQKLGISKPSTQPH